MDMVAELGGIGGIIGGAIAGFAIYFILLFIMDLTTIIKKKYKIEKYQYTVDYYKHNLPKYRTIIEDRLKKLGVDPYEQEKTLKSSILKEGGSGDFGGNDYADEDDEDGEMAGLAGGKKINYEDRDKNRDPFGKEALLSDFKLVEDMIHYLVPEYNENKAWCKDQKDHCDNIFHGVKGEKDEHLKGNNLGEKPKAGFLDKIKIKLKLKKKTDFAEEE